MIKRYCTEMHEAHFTRRRGIIFNCVIEHRSSKQNTNHIIDSRIATMRANLRLDIPLHVLNEFKKIFPLNTALLQTRDNLQNSIARTLKACNIQNKAVNEKICQNG